jgi:hypothetical protein
MALQSGQGGRSEGAREVEMNDGTGTDQEMNMNAAAAAAIIAEADARARPVLRPDHRVTFLVWGVIWFIGDGLMWLAVRGQHPYHGPNPGGYAALVLLTVLVGLASVAQSRAESGVRGLSVVRRWTFSLSALAGLGGAFLVEGALVRAGASRPVVGVFEAVAPLLVIGLLYLARFSAEPDWAVAGLGLWLVLVAAAGAYAGPQNVWAVTTLAVGPAFLLVAALDHRRQRA